MLKVLELFAGVGACSKALDNIGVEHEIVDAVEIDKYAVKSFNAIHGTNFEPQDITKWDKDIQVDLIMHGSPCQDFSVAGRQAGGDKDSGTRSSLMYETLRIVEKLKPKYVIWENVKNLLSKKHRHNFDAYLEAMEELGYTNFYQVLNAKNCGIPQNRERVFTISIRADIKQDFVFPEPITLERRLKDMLETDVDEKYYLSDERLSAIKAWEDRQKENGRGFRFEVKDGESIGRAITTSGDRPSSTNYAKVERIGGIYDKDGQTHQAGSIYDDGGLAPTLSTMQGDHQEPLIAQPVKRRRSEYGKEVRKAYENHELPHSEAMREYYVGNDGIMSTLTSSKREQKIAIKTANSKGYDLAEDGDGIDLAYPDSQTRRGRVGHGVAKTLATSDNQGCLDRMRIRKLTPRECWRLMGFDDADFNKAQKVNSNTQLYKQAGNSIVVKVLEKILYNLLKEEDGKTVTV